MSVQRHRVTLVFDRHQFCIFHIDENLIRLCKFHIAGNADRHIIRGVDRNAASISFFWDYVITALGDGRARSGDRLGRIRIFLRSYAIFRKAPPLEQVH